MSASDTNTERAAAATNLLYDHLNTQIEVLRVELGKVDATTRNIQLSIERMHGENAAEQVKENRANIGKLEERLRAVENFQNNLTGRLVVLAGIVAMLSALAVGLVLRVFGR